MKEKYDWMREGCNFKDKKIIKINSKSTEAGRI